MLTNQQIDDFIDDLEADLKLYSHVIFNLKNIDHHYYDGEVGLFNKYMEIAGIENIDELKHEIIKNQTQIKKFVEEYYKHFTGKHEVTKSFPYILAIIFLKREKFSEEILLSIKFGHNNPAWVEDRPRATLKIANDLHANKREQQE
ncbi:hypothetical protein [Delftia acidovorans]|uniref:hypothetical protein n=1 Tax=Delftia acidovorans TaxID=80866 RepID=UPI001C0C229D|nr:hypothetical protein [Delftia acidovorans]